MKKIFMIIISAVIVVGMAMGGFYLYKRSTPEYALAKTMEDIKTSGMSGLKKHLTAEAAEKVEAAEAWMDQPGVSDLLQAITQEKVVSFLKSKISEVNWTVEDILKGKNHTDVRIGFHYKDSIAGTVQLIMIWEDKEWKIDGLSLTDIDKLSLW